MNIRRVIGKYLLLYIFTNWTSIDITNNLLIINTTEFVTRALRSSHKDIVTLWFDIV